jgi:hypothetical protein
VDFSKGLKHTLDAFSVDKHQHEKLVLGKKPVNSPSLSGVWPVPFRDAVVAVLGEIDTSIARRR